MRKLISVTVSPELSPRIENWLISREIYYEVETVKRKNCIFLKILASFSEDETGMHQSEMFERFVDRVTRKEGGKS